MEDARDLNVDQRVALEAASSMLKTDTDLKSRKSKLNKELLEDLRRH